MSACPVCPERPEGVEGSEVEGRKCRTLLGSVNLNKKEKTDE